MIAWFARNGVAANLLMIVIVVMGAVTIPGLKKEIFPEYAMDMVTVGVDFRGGTPEEIEETVCVRIEEEIQDLDGIKKITSTASEGNGTVMIEVSPGYDSRRLLDDIKSRVATILRQAVTATFARRGTPLPTLVPPVGLSDEFVADASKQTQWRAFTTRNKLDAPSLETVVSHLREFLRMVVRPSA